MDGGPTWITPQRKLNQGVSTLSVWPCLIMNIIYKNNEFKLNDKNNVEYDPYRSHDVWTLEEVQYLLSGVDLQAPYRRSWCDCCILLFFWDLLHDIFILSHFTIDVTTIQFSLVNSPRTDRICPCGTHVLGCLVYVWLGEHNWLQTKINNKLVPHSHSYIGYVSSKAIIFPR